MAMIGGSTWNCRINGDHACGTRESRESWTLANRELGNYLMQSLFMYILQSDNYFILLQLLHLTSITSSYFVLLQLLHLTSFYFVLLCFTYSYSVCSHSLLHTSYLTSTLITRLVTHPRLQFHWFCWFSNHAVIDIEKIIQSFPTGIQPPTSCKNWWIQLLINGVIPGTGRSLVPHW